ncbi:MAG: type I restriction enzyme M protein [Psychroserpens sp.]|jgi:type I restriction enzyme M protein
MTEQKAQLQQQLWIIANTLRGKINANEFRDYLLPFIFYKYLNTKMKVYANAILAKHHLSFDQLEDHAQEATLIAQI